MKYLSLIICGLISIQLTAQNAVEKYFSNHLDNDEATVVQVSGKLFQYAAAIVPEEMESDEEFPIKDAKNFLGNITSFTLVKVDALKNSNEEYKRGLTSLGSEFEELVRVRDKDNKVSIMIHESNDVIHEIVALITTEKEFVAAALTGEMKLDQIQDIISSIESKEMESIMRGVDVELEDMKVYPNPTTPNSTMVLEIPEKMMGAEAVIFDMSGNQVRTMTINDRKTEIDTNGLSEGQYVMAVDKAGVTLKKSFIVVN